MMTSAQVVETSVNVTSNSPSQDYTHPDDHNLPNYNIILIIIAAATWQTWLISCLIKIIFGHIRTYGLVLYKQGIIRTNLYIGISYSPSFTETKHDDSKDDCDDKDDDERQDQYQQKVTSKVPCRRVIHWCNISWFIKSFSTEHWLGVITDNQSCFTLVHLQKQSKENGMRRSLPEVSHKYATKLCTLVKGMVFKQFGLGWEIEIG